MQGLLTWLSVLVGVLGLGAFVLFWGRHGRRVDWHPVCRGCGYDLFGLKIVEGSVCPECGRSLMRPRALVLGRRERQLGVIWCGAVLVLAAIAGVGVVGRAAYRGLQKDENKPVWWLMRDAKSSATGVRDGALREFYRRMKNSALSNEQARQVVDRILELQADESVTWNAGWGDMVELAWSQKRLDEERLRRYFQQGIAFEFEHRKAVRVGEGIPHRAGFNWKRLGRGESFGDHAIGAGYVLDSNGTFLLDGRSISLHFIEGGRRYISTSFNENWSTASLSDRNVLRGVGEGPHTLELIVHSKLSLTPDSPPAVSLEFRRSSNLTVLPNDAPGAELIDSAAARKAAVDGIRVAVYRCPEISSTVVAVQMNRFPMDFAADVIIRAGDKEWMTDLPVTMKAGSSRGWASIQGLDRGIGVVDVVLRSSVDGARTTVGMTRLWGGELVFKGVQVIEVKDPDSDVPLSPVRPLVVGK